MIFDRWMDYIKDDVPITSLVIPGAHNAGSYGMTLMSECQKDGLLEQFNYGVRHFCLRLNTDRRGNIVLAHGISKGDYFESALSDIRQMLMNSNDILLLDIREYYSQRIGPITLKYKAEIRKVNSLLARYISPRELAFYKFDDIKNVTLGDIREAGKRYILINEFDSYDFSRSCECIKPWEKKVNGAKAENFAAQTLRFFDDYKTDGLYWLQLQQTPNLGTEVGVTPPKMLDDDLRKYFKQIIKGIEDNPEYLDSANIIASDFMTKDYMKASEILKLNLIKGNVKDGLEEEYAKGIAINL